MIPRQVMLEQIPDRPRRTPRIPPRCGLRVLSALSDSKAWVAISVLKPRCGAEPGGAEGRGVKAIQPSDVARMTCVFFFIFGVSKSAKEL